MQECAYQQSLLMIIVIVNISYFCVPQVPSQFRYPFFTEIHWYVLERYVSTLLGRNHIKIPKEEEEEEEEARDSEEEEDSEDLEPAENESAK